MGKNYEYKLLKEIVADEDLFQDKTHENIAKSLANLISKEDQGITIGLEGPWGSGKSSVISMLKKHIKVNQTNCNIPIFQFDTWAHEEDHLRKIFLESLSKYIISELEKNDPDSSGIIYYLKEQKDKISNRVKVKTITTKKSITRLGLIFTFFTLFVPFGAATLSTVDLSLLALSGSFYFEFWLGVLPSIAPLLVVIGNMIHIALNKGSKEKGFWNSDNWAFLQNNDSEIETKEFSEDDERTSIEFEEYFFEILKTVFGSPIFNKLIIIIDNLDRIDSDNALKVWSTLQTFLQERNESEFDKRANFDKVWVIVPYDPDGLNALWNNNTSKSFFDKCFQLRVEVPKPVFSEWEKFTRLLVEESIPTWDKSDKKELVNILHLTRKGLNDILTPRELKNYINQTAYLASRWGNSMAMSSIAYYVCWRELEHQSVDTIRKNLIDNKLIDYNEKEVNYEENHKKGLSPTYKKDLSGLVFGVSPDRGYELLLLPEIISALNTNNFQRLSELKDQNEDGFWSLFKRLFITRNLNDITLLKYAEPILETLRDNESNIVDYIDKLKTINLTSPIEEEFPTDIFYKKYKSSLQLLPKNESFALDLYNSLIKSFNDNLKEKNLIWIKDSFTIIQSLITDVVSVTDKMKTFYIDFTEEQFITWASIHIERKENVVTKYIFAKEEMLDNLCNSFTESNEIVSDYKNAFLYLLDTPYQYQWTTFIQEAYSLINRLPTESFPGVFEILERIVLMDQKIGAKYDNLIKTWPLYNAFFNDTESSSIQVAIIVGILLNTKLHITQVPPAHSSANGYSAITTFWETNDDENADKIIEHINPYNKLNFLWELAEDHKNELVFGIIKKASFENRILNLFNRKGVLNKIENLHKYFENEETVLKITSSFLNYKTIDEEVLEDKELMNPVGIYYYLKTPNAGNRLISSQIKVFLKKVEKETWKQIFEDGSYILKIAVLMNYDGKLGLIKEYCDAIVDFSEDIMANPDILSDWEEKNWESLIDVMTKSKKSTYSSKINLNFQDNPDSFSNKFLYINLEYLDYKAFMNIPNNYYKFIVGSIEGKSIEKIQYFMSQLSDFGIIRIPNLEVDKKEEILNLLITNKELLEDGREGLPDEIAHILDIKIPPVEKILDKENQEGHNNNA